MCILHVTISLYNWKIWIFGEWFCYIQLAWNSREWLCALCSPASLWTFHSAVTQFLVLFVVTFFPCIAPTSNISQKLSDFFFFNTAVKMFSVKDQNVKGMSNSFVTQPMKGRFWARGCQDKPLNWRCSCNVIMWLQGGGWVGSGRERWRQHKTKPMKRKTQWHHQPSVTCSGGGRS